MGSRVLTVANLVMGSLFLISAGLQYNDPDPLRWAAVYVGAAGACFLSVSGRTRHARWLALAVGAVTLVWAAMLSPIIPEIRLNELAQSMHAENPRIEVSREFLGLVIILGWMSLLVWVARRPAHGGQKLHG